VDPPGNGSGSGSGEQPGSGNSSGAGDEQGSGSGSGAEEQPGAGAPPDSGQEGEITVTGSAALQERLNGLEDNTPATPYRVKVEGFNLANARAGDSLRTLYTALSRYVIFDFSDSYGETFANASIDSNPNKANITGIILPPGLRTIETNAFDRCINLVSADLSGVATINRGAFSRCEKLETLLTEEVTEIADAVSGNGAFHNCISLVSVSLPKAVKIGIKTFNSCDSLSTVYAPKATVIGEKAFAGCKNLKHIVLGETPPELGDSVFASKKPEAIYVPASAVNTYKNTDVTGWTEALKAKVQAMP
jgi:hypothetical protein